MKLCANAFFISASFVLFDVQLLNANDTHTVDAIEQSSTENDEKWWGMAQNFNLGINGFDKNREQASEYFLKAIKLLNRKEDETLQDPIVNSRLSRIIDILLSETTNNPYDLYRLACFYEDGMGDGFILVADQNKAKELYHRSLGLLESEIKDETGRAPYYAYDMMNKLGRPDRESLPCLFDSALKGYVDAQFKVGEKLHSSYHDLLDENDTPPADSTFLFMYFTSDACTPLYQEKQQSHPQTNSKKFMDILSHETIKWLRSAALQNQSDACILLGDCYEKGIGVSKNMKLALLWYLYSRSIHKSDGLADYLGSIPREVYIKYGLNPEWKSIKCELVPIPSGVDFTLKAKTNKMD